MKKKERTNERNMKKKRRDGENFINKLIFQHNKKNLKFILKLG